MSNRNFNTRQMKIAFFDSDDDGSSSSLEAGAINKLLMAIRYGVDRMAN